MAQPVILPYLWSLLYPALSKPRGKRVVKAFGDVGDQLRNDAAFGVREAMIEECTQDAYPAHLRNSGLPVVRGEAPAAQLGVLRGRWDFSRRIGGVEGLVQALGRLGYAGCTVTSQLNLYLAGNLTAFGGMQGYFFVTIPWPNGFGLGGVWDGGGHWDDGALWDGTEPYKGAMEDIKYTCRKFKHACSSCRFVKLYLSAVKSVNVPVGDLWEWANGPAPDFYLRNY